MYTIKISRSIDKEDLPTTYQVANDERKTILTLLEYLQQHYDPSISFSYSCRTGLCGTCTILANGKPKLSCLTIAQTKDNFLHLAPLPNRELISDLVTKPS